MRNFNIRLKIVCSIFQAGNYAHGKAEIKILQILVTYYSKKNLIHNDAMLEYHISGQHCAVIADFEEKLNEINFRESLID